LAATFAGGVFEAVTFAAGAAGAAGLAVLWGIALLLFLVDLAAEALLAARESFTETRARPLETLRLAAAAFLVLFEALFLRVFCDTSLRAELPRPCLMLREP
jgi:uncharacterized membrane protein